MTAPSLSQFTSEIRNRNVARPSRYYVEIVPPTVLKTSEFGGFMNSGLVSMWCSQAMTPQSTIMTKDDYIEDGVRRKFAYDQDYQNLTLHFYVDQDFDTQLFFDLWHEAVIPHRRKFGYPDDYTAPSLNLFLLNQKDEVTYKYEYSNIYPKSINSVELSYANGNQVSTFSIDFVFEKAYFSSVKNGINVVNSKPTIRLREKPPTKSLNPEVKQNVSEDVNYDQLGNVIINPLTF